MLSGPELATPAVQEHLAYVRDMRAGSSVTAADDGVAGRVAGSGAVAVFFSTAASANARGTQPADGGLAELAAASGSTDGGSSAVSGRCWYAGGSALEGDASARYGEDRTAAVAATSAVSDLQYLDNHADLFSDFDALDDDQTETN